MVPYRLWRFSYKFEHPKSTPYYFSLPLILLVTHNNMYIYILYVYYLYFPWFNQVAFRLKPPRGASNPKKITCSVVDGSNINIKNSKVLATSSHVTTFKFVEQHKHALPIGPCGIERARGKLRNMSGNKHGLGPGPFIAHAARKEVICTWTCKTW